MRLPGPLWCSRWLLLLLAVLIAACGGHRHSAPDFGQQVGAQLEHLLLAPESPPAAVAPGRAAYWHRSLERFYAGRRYQPAWVGPHGALRQADDLLAALTTGAGQGLSGHLYRHQQLAVAVAASRRESSPMELARLDLLLSETFIVYADHLRQGLVDPRQVNPHWHVPDRPGDLAGLLTTSLALHAVAGNLARLVPHRGAYGDLARFLPVSRGHQRAQIEANLERWRWLPRDLGGDYILVRLAAFELEWVHAGAAPVDRRVIVGEPLRRTPSFASQITDIIVHPSWHVPATIAREELVPMVQRDPDVLRRQGFRIVRAQETVDPAQVNWHDEEQTAVLRFVQAPGGGNPLGAVKFQLPNPFAIFLHDTPAPALFTTTDRDLSHGCVRVDGAVDLARQMIVDGPMQTRFEALLQGGVSGTIHLAQPLPVYFIYWTVDVVDDQLRVLRDVYAEDATLTAALARATAAPHTRTWGALQP